MLKVEGYRSGQLISIEGIMLIVTKDGLLVGRDGVLTDEQEQRIAAVAAQVAYESDGEPTPDEPSDSIPAAAEELGGSKDDYKKSQLLAALDVLDEESSKASTKSELWSQLKEAASNQGLSVVEAALEASL